MEFYRFFLIESSSASCQDFKGCKVSWLMVPSCFILHKVFPHLVLFCWSLRVSYTTLYLIWGFQELSDIASWLSSLRSFRGPQSLTFEFSHWAIVKHISVQLRVLYSSIPQLMQSIFLSLLNYKLLNKLSASSLTSFLLPLLLFL